MPTMDVLKEAVYDGLIEKTLSDTIVTLSEKGKDAKLKRLKVSGLSADAVVLRLDKTHLDTIFKGGRGQCKRCDYVIFSEHNQQPYVVFVEMKSTSLSEHHYVQQFKGAECLVDFMDSVMSRFYEENGLLAKRKKRFVVVYKLPIGKTPTRPEKAVRNSSPEDALTYALDYAEGDVPCAELREFIEELGEFRA